MTKRKATITYGTLTKDVCYATLHGVCQYDITVTGENEIICIKKAEDKSETPEKFEFKYKRKDEINLLH